MTFRLAEGTSRSRDGQSTEMDTGGVSSSRSFRHCRRLHFCWPANEIRVFRDDTDESDMTDEPDAISSKRIMDVSDTDIIGPSSPVCKCQITVMDDLTVFYSTGYT